MSGATRTQVYFTRELRDRLDARAEAEGKTLAEVVREATGAYLTEDDVVHVKLPAALRRQLTEEARRSGRDEAAVVEEALAEHLRTHRPNGAAVDAVMKKFFGADPDFEMPDRSEWDRSDRWPGW